MQDTKPPIVAGDKVWFLDGYLLYVAEVLEARTLLDGTPEEFQMFKLRLKTSQRDHVPRTCLYKVDEEKSRLEMTLTQRMELMRNYLEELRVYDAQDPLEVGIQ